MFNKLFTFDNLGKLSLIYLGTVFTTTFVSGVYGGYKYQNNREASNCMLNGLNKSLLLPLDLPIYIGKGLKYLENYKKL